MTAPTTSGDSVWAALSSPERRRIVDRLRERPALTGELTDWLASAGHPGSRFATQRHLRVLRDAGLVLVQQRGRERINTLNASALYEATIGWLDPVSRSHATHLHQLKNHLEHPPGGPRKDTGMDISHFDISQKVTIAAPRAKVFDAFTDDVSAWWGAPYVLTDGAADGAWTIEIEPRSGGLVVETHGARTALWGTVTSFERDRELAWTGGMGMGGGSTGEISFTFSDDDGGTTVEVRHQAIGAFDEQMAPSYGYGWDDLLHRLGAHVVDGRDYGIAGENREPDGFTHN